MKILLINPPDDLDVPMFVPVDYGKKARSNQMPLGLLYLYSYVKNDHEVAILDMNAQKMFIHEKINSFKPDIIGITCVIGKWPTVKALAKRIKLFHDIPIAVGGVNPSLYPWETLQCQDIDYVIAGFGQVPLNHLSYNLKYKIKDSIPNVYTRNNCKEKIKGSFPLLNVDNFPMPDRSILNINDYTMPFFSDGPATSMITSMGCPYSCNFCFSKTFKPVKLRQPENIVKEMKSIQDIGIQFVIFNDELFTMNTTRIKNICTSMKSKKINLKWAIRSRANLIDEESIKIMADSGCISIHLGIESGTDRILEKMGKNITTDIATKSVKMIKKAGLKVTASFMLGYITETEEEILQTINFAKDLELDNAQYFIVQPEPGTILYEEVKAIKGLSDDIYSNFVLHPDKVDLTYNIASDIFSKQQMDEFITYAYSQTKTLYDIKGEEQ